MLIFDMNAVELPGVDAKQNNLPPECGQPIDAGDWVGGTLTRYLTLIEVAYRVKMCSSPGDWALKLWTRSIIWNLILACNFIAKEYPYVQILTISIYSKY
jgi:hypothetical protein